MRARVHRLWPAYALAGLITLAVATRLVGLNSGLWVDEIFSLLESFRSSFVTIVTTYRGDNHHPLYSVLAHASRWAFGEAPWALRLPALLFGVATVPALYALARPLVACREALLAAAFLTLSYHHVWFSQNARSYTAIAFFTVVGTTALLRGWASGRRSWYVLYAVAAGLGAYAHLTMVLVVVGHALGMAAVLVATGSLRDARALRGPLLAFGLGAGITLCCYAPMLDGVVDYFVNKPSVLRGVSTPSWAVSELLRVLSLGLGGGSAGLGTGLVAVGVALGGAGLVSLGCRSPLFVGLFLGPFAATLAGAALARGTLYPRFFFFAIGPAILVAVRGGFACADWLAVRLGRSVKFGQQLALAGGGLVLLASALSLGFNYRYPKQDFEGAMDYVLAERSPVDRVVSVRVPGDPYRRLYARDWPSANSLAELETLRNPDGRTWIVYTMKRYIEAAAPDLAAAIRRECPAPRVFPGTIGDGAVFVCTLEPRRP